MVDGSMIPRQRRGELTPHLAGKLHSYGFLGEG